MKKITLLTLMGFLLSYGIASADTVNNYTVDFNKTISTTDHEFKVASGWGHLAEASAYSRYVSYTYYPTGGVDDSGYLKVGTNEFSDGYGDYETITDLLITPAITGSAKIKVRLESNSGTIRFYNVAYENGTYKKGAAINVTQPDLNKDDFTEITIPSLSGQRIGIACNNVSIDDFSAESADVELSKSLKVNSLTGTANNSAVDVTDDGTFPISFTATIENNGDTDLAPGDKNYSLSIVNSSNDSTLVTVPVSVPLAVGATTTVDLAANVEYSKVSKNARYDVRENLTGTSKMGSWVKPIPNSPIFSLVDGDGRLYADTSVTVSPIAFGIITADASKSLTIKNDGAKDLNITDLSASEGFTVDKSAPFVVAKHGVSTFNVTMLASAPGTKEGTLTIKGDNVDKTISLTGQVLDPDAWYVSFEDNKIPSNMYTDGSWTTTSISGNKLANNNYAAQIPNEGDVAKLVSPKLKVADGDMLTFAAARRGDNSFVNVYYSADRHNWTKVRTVSTTAEDATDRLTDEYTGTKWGSNTYYNFQTYTVDNIPAGQWYVAFESGYSRIDDILGYKVVAVDHDVAVTNFDAPSEATVNKDITITATVKNLTGNVESGYTAKLYLGGEEVASAEAPAIEAYGTNTYTFTIAPHKSGTSKLAFVLRSEGFIATDTTAIAVADEVAFKEVQVLTPTNVANYNVPVNGWEQNSQSETNYSAEQLGLSAGSKITGIAYKGYVPSGSLNRAVQIYVENTTDDVNFSSPYTAADTAKMTKVFDGKISVTPDLGTETEPGYVISAAFPEPFTYNGGNLRVFVNAAGTGYKKVFFQTDADANRQAITRSVSSGSIDNASWSTTSAPVAYFSVESTPKVISGHITDTEGRAVANAYVALTSGNVLYADSTDDDGNYSITVVQDDKSYQFQVFATGYNPYIKKDFSAAKDTTVNIALATAKGFFISASEFPKTATVNHSYEATVSAQNTTATEIKAADYSAILYVDGKAAATAAATDAAAGAAVTLRFVYTPHVVSSNAKAYVVIATKNDTVTSDTAFIDIKAEKAVKEVVVGTPGTAVRPGYSTKVGPINSYDKISESEIVYTKDLLNLDAGTVITKITFKGYHARTITAPVRVYMENTEDKLSDGTFSAVHDTTTMTKVLDKTLTFTEGGSDGNLIDELVIDLGDGFTYTGDNLRIVTAFGPSDKWGTISIESDNSVHDCSYSRSHDSDISSAMFYATALPVAHIYVVTSKTLSGTVTAKDGNNVVPLEGATVTLKSGEVEYYGTTNAEGKYSVDVTQTSLDYTVTIFAEGYDSISSSVSLAAGDATYDAELKKSVATAITDIKAAKGRSNTGDVYTIDGVLVRRAGQSLAGLRRGLYIVDGKKVVIR